MALGEYLGAGSGTTVGLYHLNGNANDSSGNSRNGTPSNMSWVEGKIGQCGSFNGSNGKIDLPNATVVSGNNARTILAWVNYSFRDTGNSIFSCIFGGGANSTGLDFSFSIVDNYANDNELRFYIRRYYDDQRSISIKSLINDGKRHLVGVTYDGTSTGGSTDYNAGIRFYVDGNQIKRDVSTGWNTDVTFNTTQANAMIGGPGPGSNYFLGLIDEVIIENRAWTPEQIKKYYTYSKGRFGIT